MEPQVGPVLTNPYRILGLQATATRRELTRRVEDLTTRLEFGKTKPYPLDFAELFPLTRTAQTVENAVQQLDNDEHKLLHAFFWFIKDDSVDELALECLENSRFDKAGEIWRKKILKSDIPNFSWLINYSTLLFLACYQNNDFEKNIKTAIQIVGNLVNHKLEELAGKIFPTTVIHFDKIVIGKKLTDTVLEFVVPALASRKLEDKVGLLTLFDSFPDEAKQHLIQRFTAQPIRSLEEAIAYSSNLRNNHNGNEIARGNNLLSYDAAIEQLLPYASNYRVKSTLNDFANEMLECAIYANNVLNNIELAITLPSWDDTALRIAENKRLLTDIQAEQQEQEQCAEIIKYAEIPIKSLTHAKVVIGLQMQALKKLDVAHSTFVMVSSLCANHVLNYHIDLFNNEMKEFEERKSGDISRLEQIIRLISQISESAEMIYNFNLDEQATFRLKKNMTAFTNVHRQLNELHSAVLREQEKKKKAKMGKYILWGIALFILFVLVSK